MIYASLFCSGYRYIVSDCDSVDVLYTQQHYTKTPEEAAAITIKSGPFIRRKHTSIYTNADVVRTMQMFG